MLRFGVLSLIVTASDGGAPDHAAAARALGAALGARDFAAAVARFEPGVARRLPAAELARQWEMMSSGLGAFKEVRVVREEPSEKGHVVYLDCVYEKGLLPLKLTFDEKLRVIGMRPASGQSTPQVEAAARAVVTQLAAGEYAKVVSQFGAEMAKALSAAQLAKAWGGVTNEAGEFQRVEEAKVEPHPPYVIVELRSRFAKDTRTVRVVLDSGLQVAGLFFLPAWAPPDYADATAFEERPLTVGVAAFPLPGILTLPKGKGPFPAVVLVHGSGPNDADESLGPNRIFKDLAWGLASQKIAVLRYPKRTYQYREKLSNSDIATVKEETMDDALAAVAALSKLKELDASHLFIAGHSMGAGLAPRMAAADAKVHGVVMLAAASRKQWHLVVEQTRYLMPPGPDADEAIRRAEESAKRIEDPALKPEDVVDGISGGYWLDMRNDDELGTAAKLTKPILVLQGERDYQVTMTDFAGWKKALAGKKNVTLKSYPALNHLFMPGTGKSTPAEYGQASHVPREVIDDLARWIRAH